MTKFNLKSSFLRNISFYLTEESDENWYENLMSTNFTNHVNKMELLRHSKKYGRYTELQKRMILWDYSEHKSIRQISRKYKASISSIFNFIKNDKLRTNTNCCQLVEQTSTWQLNKNKKDFIENLVRPPTYQLTIDKINK